MKSSQGFDTKVDESAFVRYIYKNQVGEAILTCKCLPTYGSGDFFNLSNLNMAQKGFVWK
jgi:hypothetical protein